MECHGTSHRDYHYLRRRHPDLLIRCVRTRFSTPKRAHAHSRERFRAVAENHRHDGHPGFHRIPVLEHYSLGQDLQRFHLPERTVRAFPIPCCQLHLRRVVSTRLPWEVILDRASRRAQDRFRPRHP
jgi:hypothetical protein